MLVACLEYATKAARRPVLPWFCDSRFRRTKWPINWREVRGAARRAAHLEALGGGSGAARTAYVVYGGETLLSARRRP